MFIKELSCSGGFGPTTFYKWRSNFGGMAAFDAATLLELEPKAVTAGAIHRRLNSSLVNWACASWPLRVCVGAKGSNVRYLSECHCNWPKGSMRFEQCWTAAQQQDRQSA